MSDDPRKEAREWFDSSRGQSLTTLVVAMIVLGLIAYTIINLDGWQRWVAIGIPVASVIGFVIWFWRSAR